MDRTKINRQLFRWGGLIILFIIAFLPRAIHPVSRPLQWYDRGVLFGDAILERDWAGTYLRYHPGVTTMWISGVGLKLFSLVENVSSAQLLGVEPTKPGVLAGALSAGVLPLAFVISLCVALNYRLIARFAGERIGLVGGVLLAIDPFYIANSKVLHVDSLLATFMLTSVLFLFNFFHCQKRSDLVWSAIFASLAFLSKSPSLFLVPYFMLTAGLFVLLPQNVKVMFWKRVWIASRSLAIWVGIAAVVYVILWPAMWVEPMEALEKIGVRILFHIDTAHYNPVYFAGKVTHDDPGIGFYLATIAWKSTWLTLPASIASLFIAIARFRKSLIARFFVLLCAFVFFFIIQMGLSARKEIAYLLPVFPAIDVIAAYGLVSLAELIGKKLILSRFKTSANGIILFCILIQACIVYPNHPYYGTHHNILLGGTETAQTILPLQDQAEGIDLAGEFLNTLPRAQNSRAAIQRRGAVPLRNSYDGLTTQFDDPFANYRVYFVNQIMRDLYIEEWGDLWERDRQTEPLYTVEFNHVPYVWVYGEPPDEPAPGGPEYALDYDLGDHIHLIRARLSAQELDAGDILTVVLYWRSDGEIENKYTVFCHLLSSTGELVAQKDGVPLYGVRPTTTWRDGEIMIDSYQLFLDQNVPAGEYTLSVGMYDPDNLIRVPVFDDGSRLIEDRIIIGTISLN